MTMINTHKAYLALQQAGVADKQAEVMVEIFAEMQQENSLTKIDLSQAMEGVVRMQHATNNRIDNLEQRFDHFEKDVTDQFQTIYKHFEKIDERFEKIDERFEKIDQRFEKIDQKFEKLDIRLGAMDQRMDQNFTALKKDSQWLKGILMAIVCTMIPATAKYMFMN
jgi:phage-related minor tail protein